MSRRRPAASSDAAGGQAGTMVSELKILQRRFERRLEQIELKVLDYLEGSILESRHQHLLQDHRLLDQEVNQEIEDRIERLGMAMNRRDEEHNDFEQCRFGRRNQESRFGRNQDSRFSHGQHQHSSYYQRHREVGRSCQHQGSRSSGTHLWTSDDSEEESEGGGGSRQSPTVRRNSYEDPASKVRMQPGMRVRSITSFPLATLEEYDSNLCLVDCSYKRYNCNKVSDYDLCPKCFASERFELGLNPLDFTCLENVIDHRPVDANSKFSSGDEESSTTRRSQHGYLPPPLRQKVSLSSHSNYLVKEFTSNEKIQSVSRIWERPPSVRLNSFKKSALSKNVLEGGSDDMKTQKDGHGILKNHTVEAIANSRVSSKTTGRIPKCKNFPVEQSVNDVAEMAIGVLLGHDFSNSQSVAYETEGHKLPRTEGCSRGSAHRNVGNNLQKSETCTEVSGQNIGTSMDTIGCMSFPSGTVSHSSMMPSEQICESSAGNTVVPKDVPRSGIIGAGDERAPDESDQDLEQDLPPDAAWVLCDDCEKWRRISVELEKTLQETNCKWTCKDNIDKAFADCSIPQEKSNDEIDAELGILVGDDTVSPICCSIGDEPSKLAAFRQDSWTPIESNVFVHRSRRYQTIDEIMVCHCNLPQDGRMGCGDQCLNRMLSIECVKETCPCGDLCSNQQFLKRKYAKFEWVRCGKKGFGLQLQENISQGQFLIEYVGEVLDFSEYDARQRSYASRGQKHFYFMTLNGGEVIDACAKGNLGRFINHSCDPNCRTEKWMVNGEVCVGLFAIRDIKKGEEVTFDYNYVRVVGAAAKKCVCGSSKCLGYIGGDPLNSEVIVEGDSDEEDIERSMICENGGRDLTVDDSVSDINAINTKVVQDDISVERKDIMVTCPLAIPKPDICGQVDNVHRPVPEADPFAIPVQPSSPMQSADTVFRPLPNISPLGDSNQVQLLETKQASTSTNEVLSDTILDSKKFISNIAEEKANTIKSYSSLKSSQSRTRVEKSKSSVKILVPHKPKTLASGTGSGCFEGVEEKLNELLDIDGGISKQKDATKGYLKLLFVTAAEGDGEACVSQSTRDLSLILDAILKTKSQKVLMDIINKNGLQMLHNIMKQNRRNFNRIPIIRKLLKVLEFLALTGILTTEQITTDAPGSGRESFKESILKLANHSDKQVHKIARSFRDKWIPRPIKRVELSERGDRRCRPRRANPSDVQSLLSIENQMPEVASSKDAMQLEDEGPPGFGLHYKDQHSQVSSKNAVITDEMVMDNKGIPSPIKHIEPSERGDRKRRTRWDNPSDLQSLLSIQDRMPKVANSEDSMQLVEGPPGFALHYKDTHSWVSSKNAEISVADVLTGKWVPRPIKPVEPSERDSKSRSWQDNPSDAQSLLSKEDQMPEFASSKGLMELDDDGPPGFGLHYKDHHSQVSSENAVITNEVVTGDKFIPPIKCIEPFERGERKHKTRWDNPSDPLPVLSRDNQVHISSSKDSMQGPPGFGVYYKDQNSGVSSRNALVTGEVVMGQVQDIFRPQLGISYGFPVYQMQQFGTRETVGGSCNSSWAIAPGIPFHPFPPLPNYPRRPPDSREQGQHIHRRFQPFKPHNRFGRDFKGRGRIGHRGSFGGNGRRGWRGSFCPPNNVNNNSNSNAGSGFH